MGKLERLNQTLEREAPAAFACLSAIGREAFMPQGIPAQAEEAQDCAYKATMGQVTDGQNQAVPLPALARALASLDINQAILYSPQGGMQALREAWGRRLDSRGRAVPRSHPLATNGLTHGLSLVADLFCGPDTPVLCPFPTWGNYRTIFSLRRGANPRFWRFFSDADTLNVEGFQAQLQELRGPAVVLLNFPGNPTGLSPTLAEWETMKRALLDHPGPLVVLCDDAYNGMVWEPGLLVSSPFYDLAQDADPARLLPIKVDGASKELGFFGGRVGFLTFGVSGEAGKALEDKAKVLIRGTISALSGPSQAAVISALGDPELEAQEAAFRGLLRERYVALRQGLRTLADTSLHPLPFNAGFFALINVQNEDADALRRRLIRDHSVGLIAIQSVNALRVAYGAISVEDIPELVSRIRHVAS